MDVSKEQARRSIVVKQIPPVCCSKHELIAEIAERYKVDVLKSEALVPDVESPAFQTCPRLELKDREQQKKLLKLAKQGKLKYDCALISAVEYGRK